MHLRIVICAFALLFSVNFSAQTSLELSVSTFNIRYDNPNDPLIWDERKDEVSKVIAFFDIVGLQEVLPNQLADIVSSLPWMSHYSVGRDYDGKGEACPIFWQTKHFELLQSETRWLSESWSETASIGWDADMPRIASIVTLYHIESRQIIRVINSHWSHIGEEARSATAALIRSWAMKGEADVVVVLGDFNAEVESDEINYLLSSGLVDSYSAAKTRCRKKFGTFTGFDPSGYAGPRIDYIFVDGAEITWTCADEFLKHGLYISDHLPVHAFISLKSQ
ncbi:MAG: endonuclease [Bacteroidetes bacterium]|nr:MAG: endonuclease [Bacteroidota bacterium]